MARPTPSDFPAPFQVYIDKTSGDDPVLELEKDLESISTFFKNIPAEKQTYAYAAGKWTMKEMLQHIIDCERIFNYRSLCIARGETQSLPGFDENEYADHSFGNDREWKGLCDEFDCVRRSNILLFRSFTSEALNRTGISNGNSICVNALGFIIAGHLQHHLKVIQERYL